MVWKTTQSAFYRAVDSFNNDKDTCENRDVPRREKSTEIINCHSPEKLPGNKCENHRRNEEYRRPNDRSDGCSREKRPESGCGDHRRNEEYRRPDNRGTCGCPHRRVYRRQPAPPKMFSDNDMLLIAGLILILMRQNADQKLILALAFVLLT